MPVDMSRYPDNWVEISNYIRFERAGGRCECTGECGQHEGRCEAIHGQPHPLTDSKVILTTAHTENKHDKMDCRPENLKAMCQRCHLIIDLDDHIHNANLTRHSKQRQAALEAGQLEMFA